MASEKLFLTGPMLPSVRAGFAGHAKQKVVDLASGAYESLEDMKERTALAVGELKDGAHDPADDQPD